MEASPVVTVVPPEFLENPQTRNQPHLFKGQPAENQLGPRGRRSNLINRQGLRLATYFWPAVGEAKGVVLCAHGHAGYLMEQLLYSEGPGKAPRYEGSWTQALNEAGWSVCGIDNQSCGFSEGLYGLRCFMNSFDDYVEDIVHFYLSLSVAPAPGFQDLPTFLMGMSLGGCLAVNAMLHKETNFLGVAMLAPMLSLEHAAKTMNPLVLALGRLLSRWWPSLPVVPAAANVLFPDLHAIWMQDPLGWHGATRARNAIEYLQACQRLSAQMPTIDFPFICFHGELDTVTDPVGSQKLYQESPSKDKTLRMVPERWHVLWKEPGNRDILQQIIHWMEARLPGPAGSKAPH